MAESKSCLSEDLPELKEIACLLKCGVCYEYISSPVLTPCSHTYCSLCIRKWLVNKQVCPSCSSDLPESSLRRHLVLERIVALFRELLQKITKYDRKEHNAMMPCVSDQISNSMSAHKSHEHAPKVPLKPDLMDSVSLHDANMDLKSRVYHSSMASPRGGLPLTSPREKVNTLSLDDDDDDADFKPQPNNYSMASTKGVSHLTSPKVTMKPPSLKKVSCPVCSVEILERSINDHLDRCLSGDPVRETRASSSSFSQVKHSTGSTLTSPSTSKRANVSEPPVKLEPLKKMVYNLMTDAQLRKELKKHGLPTQGDRRTLQSRLQRFVVIYNAECDALEPRSMTEIKAQLTNEEKLFNTSSASTAISKILKSRKADPNTIESMNKEYRQKNSSHYNKLIEEIRKRDKKPLSKKDCNVQNDSRDHKNVDNLNSDDGQEIPSNRNVGQKKEEVPCNETDSDEEYFTFTKSHTLSLKRKLIDASNKSDVTNGFEDSNNLETHSSGKNVRGNKKKKASKSVADVHFMKEMDLEQCARKSPVLTRGKSRQVVNSQHNLPVTQITPKCSPEKSLPEIDENFRSPGSESLMSPTPDLFDDASVDSFISIPPGQRAVSQSEKNNGNSDDNSRDLNNFISLLSDGSDTDFEDN